MLTLIGEPQTPTIVHLTDQYGEEIGKEILEMCKMVEEEVKQVNDPRYAIPIEYRLVFTKSDTVGGISLSKAANSGLEALVITKPIDHEKTHPYLTREAAEIVNRMLLEQLTPDEYKSRLKKAFTDRIRFTDYDFRAVVHKEKWRNSPKNQYYYYTSRPEVHRYSDEALMYMVNKICSDPDYLHRARESYQYHLKQGRVSKEK